MTNETFTTIRINKSGKDYIKAKLEDYGLAWNLDATIGEIEEKADNDGSDFVSEHGYEYETGTRCPRGYVRTIALDPEHFDFVEETYS